MRVLWATTGDMQARRLDVRSVEAHASGWTEKVRSVRLLESISCEEGAARHANNIAKQQIRTRT
eukprot:4113901-Pleurochrysis_carterae.AAC.10